MRKYKTIMKEAQVLSAMVCDRCKVDLYCDFREEQEALIWGMIGGYNSVFGDGSRIELDLCQQCVKAVLGDWIVITEGRYNEFCRCDT